MGKKIEHNHLLVNAKISKYPTDVVKARDFLNYLVDLNHLINEPISFIILFLMVYHRIYLM